MSDYTDDGFPRERYEGPMAAKARTSVADARGGSAMSKTVELMLLDERGQFVASLHPTVTSAPEFVKFENRHYRRTGKLRDSPEEWQYDRTHTVSGRKDCVVFVGDGCPVWRTGDPPMESAVEQTHHTGQGFPGCPACVASIPPADGAFCKDERPDPRDATIAEQAAEIERLKTLLSTATAEARTLKETTAHELCDAALNFESQDLYAALEAERDELRAEVARLRDRLLQSLAECGADQAAAEKQVCALADGLDAANVRAEKYLAVIAAQSDMIEAQERHNEISLRLSQAYSVAGFATDVLQVGDVPRVKEADNG